MPFIKHGFVHDGKLLDCGQHWYYKSVKDFNDIYTAWGKGKVWHIAKQESVDSAFMNGELVILPKGVFTGIVIYLT